MLLTIGGVTMRYAWVSQRGYYPDSPLKANQDQFAIHPMLGDLQDVAFFAVYDGHGKDGDGVSSYCRDKLHVNVHRALNGVNTTTTDLKDILIDVHEETNANLHVDKQVNDSLSGTTSISILFCGKTMYISNVGDSRAIVVSKTEGDKIIAEAMSNDQTPYRKDERERCKTLYGARVLTMDQIEGIEPIHENWGDLTLGEQIDEGGDPPRIWAPTGSYPGTAFTRSIGDRVAEEFGVVATPEIVKRNVHREDKYIVIASDGVWEFITNKMVADILEQHPDPLQACRSIVALAYELWLQYEIRTDDITIIAFYIEDNQNNYDDISDATPQEVKIGVTYTKPVRRAVSREQRQKMIEDTEAVMADDVHIDFITPIEKLMADRYVPKTEAERNSILNSITQNFLFDHMDNASKIGLAHVMSRVVVSPGDIIIAQGDIARSFYVVESGKYEVRIKTQSENDSEHGSLVHIYEQVDGINPSFGELSVMYGKPRGATVLAVTPGVLWTLDIHLFARLVLKANYHQKVLLRTLKSIHLLKCLNTVQLQKILNIMEEEHFLFGDYIVSQGDVDDKLYIIHHGRCKCTLNTVLDNDKSVETPIAVLKEGDYFGERAMLRAENKSANVVAETNVSCYFVTKTAFERVLGPLSQLIDQDAKRRAVAAEKLQHAPEIFQDISIKGTILSDTYGSLTAGSFKSDVCNVTVRSYILSEVEAKWLTRGITSTLEATRIIAQNTSKNVLIPELVRSFRGENSLHLVYSGVIVSDLVSLIRSCGAMGSEPSLYIATCIVAALEALHSYGILYRAVQPECLYIDSVGHVVLMDYEVCKIGGIGGRSYTICGSSDYLSPEQISQEGHGTAVDFWQLGVLLFEVSAGTNIFTCTTELDTYTKIRTFATSLRSTIDFPESVSPPIRALITKLLVGNPSRRLGAGKEGFEGLKKHPSFSKVNWNEKFIQKSPLCAFTELEMQDVLERSVDAELIAKWNNSTLSDHSWVDEMLMECNMLELMSRNSSLYEVVSSRMQSASSSGRTSGRTSPSTIRKIASSAQSVTAKPI